MPEPTKNPEEAVWIRQARSGDDRAYGRLVEAFEGPVYNVCFRMLGDPQEAEDAAQETFLKAYRNLNQYDPNRKFVNWLLAIASNHCVDRLRRRRLTLIPFDELRLWDPPQGEHGTPEPELTQRELEADVKELLGELGATDRAAIVLRYWHELSYAEIAAALRLTESAVKSRLHRARNQLANAWSARQSSSEQVQRRADEARTV
ncbi:MAG: sigma-70 family RNA polymerase sigma factor [Anaerolineales bacterium]|nr:sigma-70 family RNA polymerase sigma factor [Anaerolineales bacterium]